MHRVAKPATEHCHLASNGTISLKYHLVALVVLLVLKIVILSVCVGGECFEKGPLSMKTAKTSDVGVTTFFSSEDLDLSTAG